MPARAISAALKEAAKSRGLITIAYSGGSRPGQARRLFVVSCSTKDFRAYEESSRKVKQYKIAKVLWVEDSSGERLINKEEVENFKPALPKLKTLQQYADYLRSELERAGWYIHQKNNMIGVGTRFKNGKPKKTPDIAIRYFNHSTYSIWDLGKNDIVTVEKEKTGMERPWRVDSKRFKNGRTFKNLHSAVELFMKEVRESGPL